MIKRYLVILVVFLVIDALWLGLVAPKLYKSQIGHLMADKVSFAPAIVFYLIYAVALLFFIVNPAVGKESIVYALVYGGLLGFAMYATYDLTNMATLKDWPLLVTIVDLVWGTFVTATTSAVSVYVIRHFNF